MRKRLTAAFMCLCLLVTLLPATAFADGKPDRDPSPAESGLCEHHPSHDEACGYTGGSEGSPCTHEHDEACYTLVTSCVHEHGPECYPVQSVSENTAALPEAEEPAEAVEPTACTHVCSEESGYITKVPDCGHEHDEACGYAPAEDGTPCAYVCRICNPQDSGSEEETGPEAECICTELCTGDNINGDCPVCGAGGVDLTACKGVESQPDTQAKAESARAITPRIAYDTLRIGNTLITGSGYWTTDGNGNLTASDAGNYNIAFNADTNTLTLNNANIAGQYDFTYNNVGAGIWAYSRSGAVSLNIQVTGNNVVSGSIGIYALSNGGEVSVTISGGGSLTASGSQNGISIVSEFSNAALAIEGTAVKASGSYSEGVWVQAGESSTGSLSVDGGSLTASGRKGILFPIGSPSLNVNDSTIVRASGGIAAGINEDDPVPTNGVGIVFNGSTGTIGEGESLTLDYGASLDANGYNVIVDGGTINDSIKNSLGDSMKYTPTITTTSLPNGTAEAAYSTTLLAEGTAPITWSVTNGFLPEGLSLDAGTGVISGTPTAEGGSTFTVEAANDYGSDSREFTLSIDKPVVIPVTGVKLDKTSLTLQETDSDTLTATVEPADAANKGLTWQWQISRDDGTTWVDIDGATGSSYMIQAVTMDMDGNQYRCTVKGADGNSVTSNAATLTVAPRQYTVTVETVGNGTASASAAAAVAGTTITLTASAAGGYHLERWEAVSGNITIDNNAFTMPAENVIVRAVFAPDAGGDSSTDGGHTADEKTDEKDSGSLSGGISIRQETDGPFTDVLKDDRFYNEVMFVWQNGLMDGTGAFTFSPDAPITRAQTALIFFRLAGSPEVEGDSPFTDVENSPATAWYYDAALWAHQKGIVAGYADHTWHPADPVSLEQLAVMFRNYANYRGYDLPAVDDLSGYADAGEVTEWAKESVRWAADRGMMNGGSSAVLNPAGIVTRARAAFMLCRFIESNSLVPSAAFPGENGDLAGTGGAGGWIQQIVGFRDLPAG